MEPHVLVRICPKDLPETWRSPATDQRRRAKPVGYVYVMESGGFHKIGFSQFPDRRLVSLSSGPHPVKLLGTVEGTVFHERLWHETYAHLHQHREWFNLEPQHVRRILLHGVPQWTPGWPTLDRCLPKRHADRLLELAMYPAQHYMTVSWWYRNPWVLSRLLDDTPLEEIATNPYGHAATA